MGIDDWQTQDNRKYVYPDDSQQHRAEYDPIEKWVKIGSKVIDFGCGDGSLLKFLEVQKKIEPLGYEISKSGVNACKQKMIPVMRDRIDKIHPELTDKSFDYAICNVTMQMVEFPEILLQEMSRIAIYQIISFPNFAYYKNRIDMMLYGRMPQPMLFGYQWFSTGHIHQLSIQDFRTFILNNKKFTIKKEHHMGSNKPGLKALKSRLPNLFSTISIFLLSSS